MKKILMPLLMILFVVGGAVGADFMKSSKASGAKADIADHKSEKKVKHGADKKDKSHGKKDKDSHGKKKKSDKKGDKKANKHKDKKGHGKSKGGHGGEGGALDLNYLKFKRQFVVPVMKKGKIDALVIMNLNYELNANAPDNVYIYEPKLRDAIMRELLGLSRDGTFGAGLTSVENYEKIRDTLLYAGQSVVPEGIKGVLILDIARQEQ